jgi:ribose/xylose/arabinose/galactoside ABC-type transport system permease subunit
VLSGYITTLKKLNIYIWRIATVVLCFGIAFLLSYAKQKNRAAISFSFKWLNFNKLNYGIGTYVFLFFIMLCEPTTICEFVQFCN